MAPPPHILIAGPTASGKSQLALRLAARLGAMVVNADALQVYDAWHLLTARPDAADHAVAPHALYGHVTAVERYSVGRWLRDLKPLLAQGDRLIIVGGTGLYLSTLIRGLAEVPAVPEATKAASAALLAGQGIDAFRSYLAIHDPALYAVVDRDNPRRLQRAWEVHQATGRPLSAWQRDTGPPLLPASQALRLTLVAEPAWLASRIDRRFDALLAAGALEEVRAARSWWDPALPASRALGAPELMAYLDGRMGWDAAVEAAKIATRQFAKRQRTWFRSNMGDWEAVDARDPGDILSRVP